MRKKLFLIAALFWTGLILFFCLESAKDIPQLSLPYIDKVVHSIFHFIFTILWFLYFKKKLNCAKIFKPLVLSFGFSFFFGISIELMQQYITTTRSADIFDVLANVVGAFLAIFSMFLLNRINNFIDKI